MTIDQIHLLLGSVSAGFAILASIFGIFNKVMVAGIKYEIQRMKTDIAEHRAHDKQELREWINGSFMRSGETKAKLDAIAEKGQSELRGIGARLTNIERSQHADHRR